MQILNDRQWYLAQYITGGKNRENLFGWLHEQKITPWTPLTVKTIKRSDKINGYRKRITTVFPGYFFLKANFEHHNITHIRMHSAFSDFVAFGRQIKPVDSGVVERLMKYFPEPDSHTLAKAELEAASAIWLTRAQYDFMVNMENDPMPLSRSAMLMDLVYHSGKYGF
ncbi:transcription termination factor NusG [Citrobacter koseri]|uniref:transcription termination/antitermination NusG family protein n=1 Tax=Enterobacterales TaxID=91347 RepID=UPI000D9A0B4E|nr:MULTISPECIES: transcription termination/antitermination NusG family protein [Enterobacterales]EJF0242671.1 transcription termination factor NusG [Salmonella enterica subsp. enterica serovar Liverpool]EKY1504569.1 transcription termination factor NusG [Enterobacter cloacae]MBE0026584.1 transcription termination factor NusG [Citrobacter koseri]MBE0080353.1 transcription termination factor NusG [Citrobacter koseri]MBH0128438.1 transcription termination factor NusG [Enterobacter sp. SECR18-0236